MEYGCQHCGWVGDDPQETRSVEGIPVGYGGPAGGGDGGGGPDVGFVVMEKKHVSKNYCPECHRPLPKSQQPKIGMTSGQFEQSLGRVLLFLILAFAGYYIFI
ncbi:MAG: hypothetical protein QGI73_02215 [Candidatus Thalassarchaeaceae archaeon]|jgi:hypothetical protein|nr:hypothetical protein [Euryarchaeota archaeon]MDP6871032.1 hypothetical protein [Candidatus Thalassarchaeaceae archaeon]|tara:strand:+ start:785 stop:1093 length:309 start_codon:yes stop_codon:yes gene_type:complete